MILCCVGADRKEENKGLLKELKGQLKTQVDMKPLVNMLPEVTTDKDRKIFQSMFTDSQDVINQKLRAGANGIKSKDIDPFSDEYEKLDFKVELLLHHLKKDLQTLVQKYGTKQL